VKVRNDMVGHGNHLGQWRRNQRQSAKYAAEPKSRAPY
jgi:hypothetical protein